MMRSRSRMISLSLERYIVFRFPSLQHAIETALFRKIVISRLELGLHRILTCSPSNILQSVQSVYTFLITRRYCRLILSINLEQLIIFLGRRGEQKLLDQYIIFKQYKKKKRAHSKIFQSLKYFCVINLELIQATVYAARLNSIRFIKG